MFFFSSPTPSLSPLRHTHSHNQGRRRKELALSCRCGGDGPTHALPPRRRAVTQPSQLESPPARGHATKCPVSPGAPPRRASRGASYGRKSERPASTRTRTSSLGARSFASRAAERHTGGAETKTSDSTGLERRHKRRGAPGDTGHLVACPLAGGASSWLGWVTAS